MVMPGDNIKVDVELVSPIACERACASRSARAARPSAPASSRRSRVEAREAAAKSPSNHHVLSSSRSRSERNDLDPTRIRIPAQGLRTQASSTSGSAGEIRRAGPSAPAPKVGGPIPLPTEDQQVLRAAVAAHRQEVACEQFENPHRTSGSSTSSSRPQQTLDA
jgi:hypothetical protein